MSCLDNKFPHAFVSTFLLYMLNAFILVLLAIYTLYSLRKVWEKSRLINISCYTAWSSQHRRVCQIKEKNMTFTSDLFLVLVYESIPKISIWKDNYLKKKLVSLNLVWTTLQSSVFIKLTKEKALWVQGHPLVWRVLSGPPRSLFQSITHFLRHTMGVSNRALLFSKVLQ